MTEQQKLPQSVNRAEKRPMWESRWFDTLGRFLALLVVFLFFAALVEEGKFYTARNLENILRQSAVYATAALGMTMVIITAGIDLSIGSIIALSVVVTAYLLKEGVAGIANMYMVYTLEGVGGLVILCSIYFMVRRRFSGPLKVLSGGLVPALLGALLWLSIQGGMAQRAHLFFEQHMAGWAFVCVLMAVLAASLAGMLNGVTIVGLRLVPFIVTLGTMGIFRGLAKGIANEKDIYPSEDTWITGIMDPALSNWIHWLTGKSDLRPEGLGCLILPLGVWILLIGAVFAALLLRYTRLGRHIFAVGSNELAARLCGVPVGRTKIIVYTLAGFFAGLAGLMQFSFIGGFGQPTTAIAYELFIIAAVVIGGGSLMGGEGSILGSVIGALIITILYMGGQQMGWPKWVQEMVIGAIIIGAVVLDRLRHRRVA